MKNYLAATVLILLLVSAIGVGVRSPLPAHAAGFVVTTNADGACGTQAGSFRCGLASVTDGSSITFAIPACGTPCVITVNGTLGGLNLLANNVMIDGRNNGANMVEINGTGTTGLSGLTLGAALSGHGNTIQYLSFVNFTGANGKGIHDTNVEAPAQPPNTISHDYVGVAPDGTTKFPNTIGIRLDSSGTVVHDSLISGNVSNGIETIGDGMSFYANRIGTTADGMHALGNGGVGISVGSDQGDCVGGLSDNPGNFSPHCLVETGNVVSGNTGDGVLVIGNGGTSVQNNLIGVAADGVSPLGNGGNGVEATTTGTIGGTGLENVIAFNANSGIKITPAAGSNLFKISRNSVHDNLITAPSPAGSGGEIYLDGQNPATCSGSTSSANHPNDYMPCPQILNYNTTTHVALVETCPGCTVELFSYHAASHDANSGGSTASLGSQIESHAACNPGAPPGCTNGAVDTVTFTGVTANGVTATASAMDTTASAPVTSEFAQDAGAPTAAMLTHLTLVRTSLVSIIAWRLAGQPAIAGFILRAAGRQLNRKLLPLHTSPEYRFSAHRYIRGPVTLYAVMKGGSQLLAGRVR